MLFFISKSSSFTQLEWFDLFWLLLSVVYLGMFIYQKQCYYIIIEKSIIRLNGPLGVKIPLNQITKVNYFAGEYMVHYQHKKAKISIASLDENAKKQLKEYFDHLHLASA
jgi:hypothetical protein